MKKLITVAACWLAMAANASNFIHNSDFMLSATAGGELGKEHITLYILGVSDALDPKKICIPVGTKAATLYDDTLKYLLAMPYEPSDKLSVSVFVALSVTYPCKKIPML